MPIVVVCSLGGGVGRSNRPSEGRVGDDTGGQGSVDAGRASSRDRSVRGGPSAMSNVGESMAVIGGFAAVGTNPLA